jgi:hypothetical protein
MLDLYDFRNCRLWAHKSSLIPQLFSEVFIPSQECGRGYICVLGVSTGADPGGAPLKLEKYDFFLRKIVIFHTKYPENCCASLRSAQFF